MHLSAVVIVKNEELRLSRCLESLLFCDEIIVIDNGSTDNSLKIAKTFQARIYSVKETDFSELRNTGKEKARGEWILYVDADEVVTPELREEIFKTIGHETVSIKQRTCDNEHMTTLSVSGNLSPVSCNSSPAHCPMSHKYSAYHIRRRNFYLGRQWPVQDKMQRLFLKEKLIRWEGKLHETAVIDGEMGDLQEPLIHNTHRTLSEMVEKTNQWSQFEAQLRYEAHHPNVVWWRLLRVMATGFFQSFIREGGWRAGTVGWIESLYQGFSMFITYAKLWEMQEKKILSIKYHR